jgi:predicted phosphate transport protein (TIGR00153 family)
MGLFGNKETDFFALFTQGISCSLEAAKQLESSFADGQINMDELTKIKEIEHKGDRLVHTALKQIEEAFITPIDRSDIIEIVKQIECITDSIEAISNRIYILRITETNDICRKFIDLIVTSCERLTELMTLLKNFKKNFSRINELVIEINRLEEEGDRTYINAVHGLFEPNTDPIKIIKLKELYEHFEDCLDKCEDVADVVEKIKITLS